MIKKNLKKSKRKQYVSGGSIKAAKIGRSSRSSKRKIEKTSVRVGAETANKPLNRFRAEKVINSQKKMTNSARKQRMNELRKSNLIKRINQGTNNDFNKRLNSVLAGKTEFKKLIIKTIQRSRNLNISEKGKLLSQFTQVVKNLEEQKQEKQNQKKQQEQEHEQTQKQEQKHENKQHQQHEQEQRINELAKELETSSKSKRQLNELPNEPPKFRFYNNIESVKNRSEIFKSNYKPEFDDGYYQQAKNKYFESGQNKINNEIIKANLLKQKTNNLPNSTNTGHNFNPNNFNPKKGKKGNNGKKKSLMTTMHEERNKRFIEERRRVFETEMASRITRLLQNETTQNNLERKRRLERYLDQLNRSKLNNNISSLDLRLLVNNIKREGVNTRGINIPVNSTNRTKSLTKKISNMFKSNISQL